MGKNRVNLGQSRTIPIQGSTPLCPEFGNLERKKAKMYKCWNEND